MDLAQRRTAVAEAIADLTSRLDEARRELRQAPTWFRRDLDLDLLPTSRRAAATRLAAVLATADRHRSLRDRLRSELISIGNGRIDQRLCWKFLARWLNGVVTPRELLDGLKRDPLTELRPRITRLDVRIAQAVLDLRTSLGGKFTDPTQLDPIGDRFPEMLAALRYTGCALIPEVPQVSHRPDIDVLLPVRLETRFDPPAAGVDWQLRLRIVPDDISIDRHDPLLSPVEVKSLADLWAASGGDLSTDEGTTAWNRFVGVHGGRRSSWLARTFPPPDDGTDWVPPAILREDPLISSVAGWPAEVEIWMGRAGGAPTRQAVLTVDRAQLGFDFPTPDDPDRRRWWNSFDRALDVGLATKIDLGPARPDDIDVIYAVGRGSDDPEVVFNAHKEAGTLSLLACGTPTNTSDLRPTDELPDTPEFWLGEVTGSLVPTPLESDVSQTLTGAADLLAPLRGSDRNDTPVSNALVGSLWSVVWQHGLADLWGVDIDAVHQSGLWAAVNLAPEGPLPAVRIGSQPYGVLPITSLADWKPEPTDPPIEADLVTAMSELRTIAATASEKRGTVVGADTERLLSIVAQPPSSPGYATRSFISLDMWRWMLWSFGEAVPSQALEAWWDAVHQVPLGLGLSPSRRHIAVGSAADLDMPLVVPPELPEGMTLSELLDMLATLPPAAFVHGDGLDRILIDGELPASLLVRLIARAMVLTAAEVERLRLNDPGPLIEPLAGDVNKPGRIASLVFQFQDAHLLSGDLATQLFVGARKAVRDLAQQVKEPAVVERVLRSTLDTAMYRVDPWITGVATRRLRDLETQNPQRRLGIYGWVDRPAPGTPGPVAESMVLAPDSAQAYTAAILRDRSLFDDEPTRWHMDIDSIIAQEAKRIADEVRIGSHISEALGRRVERIVADPATIDQLRAAFPIRTEHSGRRTCDGQAVLDVLTSSPNSLPASITGPMRAAIGGLVDVMDGYADLLVADAVHDVVSGRGEVAGTSMEAAAGFNSPPNLDVLKTPRSGRAVTTNLLTAIPSAPPNNDVDITFASSPSTLADPSVAAWLAAETGASDSAAWTWAVVDNTDQTTPVRRNVTLADLDMSPIDALAVSPETLGDLAAETAGPAFVSDSSVEVTPTATYRTAQHRLAVLGRRPAMPEDVSDGTQPDPQAVFDELLARYGQLRRAAGLLIGEIPVAAASADPAVKRRVLLAGHRWGITPLPEASVPSGDPNGQLAAISDALQARLDAAPPIGDPTLDGAAETLGLPELTRAISGFASPEAKIPVLSTMTIADLRQHLTLVAIDPATGLGELDAEWLDIVSGVRDPAGVLSVHQLEAAIDGRGSLEAWTNRPGDPWQTGVDPNPAPDALPTTTRLVAVYAPPGVVGGDPNDRVAAGLLDSWGEMIPTVEHTVSAAFGFDAPGSKAPQAILVAVPPVVGTDLTTKSLVTMLGETRELARARVARPQEVGVLGSAAPLTMFPANGRGAVVLESS